MQHKRFTLLLLILFPVSLLAQQKEVRHVIWENWNDETLKEWTYEHQDTSSVCQCSAENGMLRIGTRQHTYDRQKMHTRRRQFAAGTYRWRTYISNIAPWEQVSIGSWIYHDDHHELDFEVGYGKQYARRECKAKDDELLVYMTNQDHPHHYSVIPIKPGWHDFAISLEMVEGHYYAKWIIDDEVKQELALEFGEEIPFYIFCSVENLKFLGEKIPEHDNYSLFERVSFDGNVVR